MPGRPATGVGHYLRDIVYGALDGVITTLAVISGATGAGLGVGLAMIFGLANLAADGISMGASNYLGLKSEVQQEQRSVAKEKPWRHGAMTAVAFVVAGGIPLIGLLVPTTFNPIVPAAFLSVLVLLAVGAARARFIRASPVRAGFEMLAVGAVAAVAAFGVGALAQQVF